MLSPFEFLSDAINKRPGAVLGVLICMIVIALLGTTLITMETGSSTYLDKSTKRGMLLDSYTKTFQSESVMLLVESDDVLNPDVIEYMDRLQGEVVSQRYITGASSIVDMVRMANGQMLPSSSAEIEKAKAQVPAEVLERYVPSNLMTIMVVTLEPGLSQDVKNTVISNIESIVALSNPPPGVQVVVTGDAAFQQQMGTEMGISMSQLILAAMVLMVIAVGILFSQVTYRFLSVIIVACGLVLTFGILGIAGIPISMVTIGAFPVLIGIGIDYAIQFHSRFDEEARHSSIPDAVRTTVTKAGPSVLTAMLSTSMGFLALMISPIPMIGDFGIVCVIGVASCYLVALIAVPTIGILLKYRPKAEKVREKAAQKAGNSEKPLLMDRYSDFLGDVAEKVAKNPVPILILLVLLAFIGFQMDNEIIINTNEDTFVPPNMPAIIDLKKVSRTMGSTSSLPIVIRGDNVLTPETIAWMADFQAYEESHNDKITGSNSIATYLAQYNGGNLPISRSELDSTLEKIPADIRSRYVAGKSELVMEFSTIDMENEVAMSMLEQVKTDLEWNPAPPGVTATVTGMGEMFTNLITEIAAGKIQMTLLAFGLIFAFLLIVYRKFGPAVTPVIPIMMIVGWNGLIMYILGIDYTPMTATLGSMTIGVASEYTILIMERVHEERARGLAPIPAIRRGVRQIGTAITVSGMTTVFGFAALTISSFNMISNFGIVTVITVGFSLIGAIIVMPVILILTTRIDPVATPESAADGTGHDGAP